MKKKVFLGKIVTEWRKSKGIVEGESSEVGEVEGNT